MLSVAKGLKWSQAYLNTAQSMGDTPINPFKSGDF